VPWPDVCSDTVRPTTECILCKLVDAALRHLDPSHDTDLRGHGGIELSLSIENPHGDDHTLRHLPGPWHRRCLAAPSFRESSGWRGIHRHVVASVPTEEMIWGKNGQRHHNSSLIWCSYQTVVVSITYGRREA